MVRAAPTIGLANMFTEFPFVTDYTSHSLNTRNVQWIKSIGDLTDHSLLTIMFQHLRFADSNYVRTILLASKDLIQHGCPNFLIKSLENGALEAMRETFRRSDLLAEGIGGFLGTLEIFEALVGVNITVCRFLLKHWSIILYPIQMQFRRLMEIVNFDRYETILGDWTKSTNIRPKLIAQAHHSLLQLSEHCYVIRRHSYVPKLQKDKGIIFSDYLNLLELISYHSIDKDNYETSVKMVAINKIIEPTHLSILYTERLIPERTREIVPGPRLNLIAVHRDVDEYFYLITNLARKMGQNLNKILLSDREILEFHKIHTNSESEKELSIKSLESSEPTKIYPVNQKIISAKLMNEPEENVVKKFMMKISSGNPLIFPHDRQPPESADDELEAVARTLVQGVIELVKKRGWIETSVDDEQCRNVGKLTKPVLTWTKHKNEYEANESEVKSSAADVPRTQSRPDKSSSSGDLNDNINVAQYVMQKVFTSLALHYSPPHVEETSLNFGDGRGHSADSPGDFSSLRSSSSSSDINVQTRYIIRKVLSNIALSFPPSHSSSKSTETYDAEAESIVKRVLLSINSEFSELQLESFSYKQRARLIVDEIMVNIGHVYPSLQELSTSSSEANNANCGEDSRKDIDDDDESNFSLRRFQWNQTAQRRHWND